MTPSVTAVIHEYYLNISDQYPDSEKDLGKGEN
jgi:hypothetical protein